MIEAGKRERDDEEDRKMLEIEKIERDLHDATEWRSRIRGPRVSIRDCNKDEILMHFDQAISAAYGYRARLMEKTPGDKLTKSECNRKYRLLHPKKKARRIPGLKTREEGSIK